MKTIFTSLALLLIISTSAQITITKDDMPDPGDSVRISTSLNLLSYNIEETGENYLWDFSALEPVSQQVDTFTNVSETPFAYQYFFNNSIFFPDYQATSAQILIETDIIPNFEISDTYLFLKNSNSDYREVGFGVGINGLTIPVQYDQIDVVYTFPMEYENIDSSMSGFELDIPDLAYFFREKNRSNYVDGWGTLITPYGEFEALRLKTVIHLYDSIAADTLGGGIPISRMITEYSWFGKGFGLALLKITEEGLIITATYIDSLRTPASVPDLLRNVYSLKVYPNPCKDQLFINYDLQHTSEVEISLYSPDGRKLQSLLNSTSGKGIHENVFNLDRKQFNPGMYILSISINGQRTSRKIIIN